MRTVGCAGVTQGLTPAGPGGIGAAGGATFLFAALPFPRQGRPRMLFLRSLVFNIAFFAWTTLVCVGGVWVLFCPRWGLLGMLTVYERGLSFLERTLIGLDYVVEGQEHLPAGGCFLVAAKHQSIWETTKLHRLLGDPGVILKQELAWIPFWGWYARKSRAVFVNRGARGRALPSLLAGAERIKAEQRPLVIFPQGTRVAAGAYAPYKIGVGLIYERLQVPMIPMALNAGLFWPRHRFLKRPGLVTIRFLPPIPPGLPRDEAMRRLETELEAACERLSLVAGGPPTRKPGACDPA